MKTAVLFDDFTSNDKNYFIIKSLNEISKGLNHNIFAFINNVSHKLMSINFPYSNMSDLSHFNDGIVIATSINTAQNSIRLHNNSKRVFYIWNMEWANINYDYMSIYKILSNTKIIVRSKMQKNILERLFNLTDIDVMSEFNLEKIHEICGST